VRGRRVPRERSHGVGKVRRVRHMNATIGPMSAIDEMNTAKRTT
jgi:hypothetical protein